MIKKSPSRFHQFVCLWIIAVGFHLIKRADLVDSIWSTCTVIAGLVALLNPRSIHRFTAFCLAHSALFLHHTPNVGNHEFFAFILEQGFLLGWLVLSYRNTFTETAWEQLLFPLMRWSTILLYSFAVLHKLNVDYFGPSSNGANFLFYFNDPLAPLLQSVLPKGAWAQFGYLYGGILIEALILTFLCFRKTAWYGVIIGLGFHYLLGLVFFWHFSPMVMALYLAFVPSVDTAAIKRTTHRIATWRRLPHLARHPLAIAAAIIGPLFLFAVAQVFPDLDLQIGAYNRGGMPVTGVVYTMGALAFALYGLGFGMIVGRSPTGLSRRGPSWRIHPAFAFVPLLFFISGLSPYLGLKTHHTFSMFSQLQTHGGQTNHFFMPLLEVTDWQRSLVTIHHPNGAQEDILRIALPDRVRAHAKMFPAELALVYAEQGALKRALDPEDFPRRPWLARAFLPFQPIAQQKDGVVHY